MEYTNSVSAILFLTRFIVVMALFGFALTFGRNRFCEIAMTITTGITGSAIIVLGLVYVGIAFTY